MSFIGLLEIHIYRIQSKMKLLQLLMKIVNLVLFLLQIIVQLLHHMIVFYGLLLFYRQK